MSEALTDTVTQTTEAASPTEAVVVSGTPDAAAQPDAGTTLATSEPADKPVAAPADWPEDWRAKVAGEDKAYLKTLERYGSPAELAKAHRELQQRMSRGELKAGLKPDASPEEVAAWRRENGLPESPEGYKPQLPNGMVPGEADAPLIGGWQKTAHELGLTPEQFNKTLAWYYTEMDADAAQRVESDKAFRAEAEDALRAEWGPQFRSEVKGIMNFMTANAPAGLADTLFQSRTADGKLLGDHPEVLRWLASITRAVNPMATLVPAGSADPMKAGEARITEIEQIMRGPDANEKYWRNPEMQAEYGRLLEAREALRSRAA